MRNLIGWGSLAAGISVGDESKLLLERLWLAWEAGRLVAG